MTFAVSLFAAGSVVVSAKPHTTSNISEVGGVRAKAVHYIPESNPKYSDEYKSKRISKLIGHKTDWRKIRDSHFDPVKDRLEEINIDPSMAPISGNGRAKRVQPGQENQKK